VKQLFDDLEREYGVRHDDPFDRNVTYRASDGRFCLIDFRTGDRPRPARRKPAS
jgi:hypothetical protein